jgi:hypothetical protein
MTITELLAATGLTSNDLVPIWDAEAAQNVEPTQKITAAQLAAAVKVLASLVNTTEMNAAIAQSTAPEVIAVYPYGQWTSYTGGYYSTGKIVFVQMTAVAGNFGANDYFTMTMSLPAPAYPTALAITTTSDNLKGAEAYVDATGKLIVKSGSIALTDQRVVVTGCYIKQ